MLILRNKIIIFVLFLTFLLFGCKEKNNTADNSRNNEESLKEVIIKETLRKRFSGGFAPFIEDMIRKDIDDTEKTVTEKLGSAINVWNSSGASPEEYYESAMIILQHLELKKGQYLTFGNIFKTLGPPTTVEEQEYVFNIEDDINDNMTRLEAQYENKGVKLLFTVCGFLKVVLLYEVSSERTGWSGCAPIHWPQNHSYSKTLPVVSGHFIGSQSTEELIKSAENMASNYPLVTDWLDLMINYDGAKDVMIRNSYPKQDKAKVTIVLVDGITEKLAKVYFNIVNTTTLYCDMWLAEEEGKWQIVSFEQAQQIIKEKPEKN